MQSFLVLAARFCARAICTARARASKTHKGRRSAERRVLRDRSALSQRCRWAGSRRAPLLADALAFRRSTAALAKFSGLAQSGPALHGSANGFNSVRHPGSQLLADRRRGRPGEFPNRPRMRLLAPSRAPLPLASIGRHRLTSLKTSRMISFSSPCSIRSRNSRDARHLSDATRIFFAVCLIRRRSNCGIAAMIRIFPLTYGEYGDFWTNQFNTNHHAAGVQRSETHQVPFRVHHATFQLDDGFHFVQPILQCPLSALLFAPYAAGVLLRAPRPCQLNGQLHEGSFRATRKIATVRLAYGISPGTFR